MSDAVNSEATNTEATHDESTVRIVGAGRGGAFVITCDHASHYIPPHYQGLGLADADLLRHIAWDIGALALSEHLAEALDAPLLHPTISRLLLDVNRHPDAHDSIPATSENTTIPGNTSLDAEERRRRRNRIYAPYHDAIAEMIAKRREQQRPTAVIAIHSFTPVYRDHARPWKIGVLSHRDRRMADPLLAALRASDASLDIGDNEPYAPENGVYHTLDRHAEAHGLPCVMIEVRNDLISEPSDQRAWADRLAPLLVRAFQDATAGQEATVRS
ncbi:N-formylglutamate amidohydrolase [Pseudoxanthomonas sp. UTMC 1351]|uniref:N-formylglutamate amidohydrolase n=1 Tax=Pseudoxanthomonas sp. UTMC 1351 TaxID=2695853 RepID=UPI0034CEA006